MTDLLTTIALCHDEVRRSFRISDDGNEKPCVFNDEGEPQDWAFNDTQAECEVWILKRAMSDALVEAANKLPSPSDENDWILPSAVCAYDIARCEVNGQKYPNASMSATNRQTIAPMIMAAIKQALFTIADKQS